MSLYVELADGVASLVIDRPARRNAFSESMWDEMPGLMAGFGVDDRVRVVVIRSAVDGVFSAGADVAEFQGAIDRQVDSSVDRIRRAFQAVIDIPKPTIAAISGACHGGGAGLATCCDIRIGDQSAEFSIPPARLGVLYPFPVLRRLVWIIGPGAARRLLFTARTFDAVEASRLGFLDEVVPTGDLGECSEALAREMAANAPGAIAAMKRVMNGLEATESQIAQLAMDLEQTAFRSVEHHEGVAAFLEKRLPRY
ncbi:MAG: enoyl-CoA hydratase/isomerase family protein [Acidimicrobiia bacterium]|nr:enoyl-CoA hydratase/isomerase family protein [Acidimicrobiia bacterium]